MNVVGPAATEGDNGSWETRYCNEQQYFSELQNQIMNDKNQSLKEPNKNLLDNRGCEAGRVRGQTDSRCFSPGTWQSLPSPLSLLSRLSVSHQPPGMEAAQKMVKQRSMEALDKLRTYATAEDSHSSVKETSQTSLCLHHGYHREGGRTLLYK